MDQKILKGEARKVLGRKVKNLRKEGFIPANIYGKKIKSLAIQIPAKEFKEVYSEAGETGLIDLKVGSEAHAVLVNNVQIHPVSDIPIHVDFREVDLKEKVEASVPVELTGEAPAEKQGVGTVVQYINEIKVEALPADLPEKFVVDISAFSEVDQAVYVKDLKIDKTKVEVKGDPEGIVVKVEPPQKEEVIETPIVPVGAEGEVTAEGEVPAEGEAPSEGKPAEGGEAPKEEPKA